MWPQLTNSANYTLNPYGLAPAVTGALAILLGVAVLIRERASLVSVAFFFLSLAGAVWLTCYLGMYSANHLSEALWWARLQKMAVAFIPGAIFLFTLAILGKVRTYRTFLGPIFLLSALFCWGMATSDRFIAGTYHYPWGNHTKYGPLYFYFLLFFLLIIAINSKLLWGEHQRAHSRTHQRRLRAFLIALGVAYLGSVDFLPGFGIPVFPSGYLAVFIFLVLAARAIWRYRLGDLTPAFAAKQILRIMADALLVLDREGTIRVANQAAAQLLGYPEKELIGKPLWLISGSFLPKERLERALRSGVIQRYETSYATRDGEELTLDVSVSAIPDQEDESIGIVCIARDITARKHLAG